MVLKDILRVLYEPHKVFKDVVKNPSYLGPMILLLLFVISQIGSAYIVGSRSFVEQTIPIRDNRDKWTENSLTWTSIPQVSIKNNTIDFINSTFYYGTTSIEFDAVNLENLGIEVSDFGESVNCGIEGFNNVSIRIKINSPDNSPSSVMLTLYSLSDSNYIYDISGEFENYQGSWKNLTLPVGSGEWIRSGSEATWENITGINLEFEWVTNSTINLLVDGLFFRGTFKSPLEVDGFSYFLNNAINSTVPFLFQWIAIAGIMYFILKWMKIEIDWKPLLVAIGFTLILLVIQGFILNILYTSVPDIYYPLEVLAGTPGEFEVAYQIIYDKISPIYNVQTAITLAINIGIIILGAIVAKTVAEYTEKTTKEFGWFKSFIVSGLSVFAAFIILGLLL